MRISVVHATGVVALAILFGGCVSEPTDVSSTPTLVVNAKPLVKAPAPLKSGPIEALTSPGPSNENQAPRPTTGDHIQPREGQRGLGTVRVSNKTSSDAVLRLVDPANGATRAMVYLRQQDDVSITGIAPCTCVLRFTQGSQWDPASIRFLSGASYSEFEDRLEFRETRTASGTDYATFEATLHAVANGNAPTEQISADAFAGG